MLTDPLQSDILRSVLAGGFRMHLRHTKRREFITLLGGAAAWPLAARAQQPVKIPRIGFLGATNSSLQKDWTAAFVGRLAERGWVEGRTVAIEYRWADGRKELFPLHLEEFIRLKVDVIVTHPDGTVLIAKQMTSTIPHHFSTNTRSRGVGSCS
jgi:putative ABC transport system substrate-binding protein